MCRPGRWSSSARTLIPARPLCLRRGGPLCGLRCSQRGHSSCRRCGHICPPLSWIRTLEEEALQCRCNKLLRYATPPRRSRNRRARGMRDTAITTVCETQKGTRTIFRGTNVAINVESAGAGISAYSIGSRCEIRDAAFDRDEMAYASALLRRSSAATSRRGTASSPGSESRRADRPA